MSQCRVSSEELQHDQAVMAKESIPHRVKCEECKETKPAEEMYLIGQWNDEEGLCDDCSEKDDVKTDWGIR